MDKTIEIQNQINRVEADIESTKNSSVFNELEISDRIKKLSIELERLQIKKIKEIEVKDEKQL